MLEVEPVLPLVVSVCQHSMLFGEDEPTNTDCVSLGGNEPAKKREEKGLWGVHVDPSIIIIPSTEGGKEGIKGALLLLRR